MHHVAHGDRAPLPLQGLDHQVALIGDVDRRADHIIGAQIDPDPPAEGGRARPPRRPQLLRARPAGEEVAVAAVQLAGEGDQQVDALGRRLRGGELVDIALLPEATTSEPPEPPKARKPRSRKPASA